MRPPQPLRLDGIHAPIAMKESLRLSEEAFRSIYEDAFQIWTRIYRRVVENHEDPDYPFLFRQVLERHPALPRTFKLEPDTGGAFVTGYSQWGTSEVGCDLDLLRFRQPLSIKVASKEPKVLSLAQGGEVGRIYKSFFEREDDFIALLVLAWTYILSARWAETIPGTCSITYTEAMATHTGASLGQDNPKIALEVLLNTSDKAEARWWAAVLAPGQGWQAHMKCQLETYISPWSIRTRTDHQFNLRHIAGGLPSSLASATFLDASRYLNKFCEIHGIFDQSHAALAVVLLLPSMGSSESLSLPIPKITTERYTRLSSCGIRGTRRSKQHDWTQSDCYIDKLLTLSCNSRGMRPMLLSVFYEPKIECNAVTPWLQGTLAAFNSVAGLDSDLTVRLCMNRAPTVGFLWLGSLIMGLHKKLLHEGLRYGQIPIDLHSAVWSGLTQSFIQQPTSDPLVSDGAVTREEECKLLFLSQSNDHARVPLCQWKPFGKTPIVDTEIEVRVHRMCKGHQLVCEGVYWKTGCGTEEFQALPQSTNGQSTHSKQKTAAPNNTEPISVCFKEMDRDREAISENATRNIFTWLRPDGCARFERKMWKHEWMQISDSEEDEADEDLSESTNGQNLNRKDKPMARDEKGHIFAWLEEMGRDKEANVTPISESAARDPTRRRSPADPKSRGAF